MHKTVQEFFGGVDAGSKFNMDSRAAHSEIMTACLRYLVLCFTNRTIPGGLQIKSWTSQDFEAYVQYLDSWPLTHYAIENLKAHLEDGDDNQARIVSML